MDFGTLIRSWGEFRRGSPRVIIIESWLVWTELWYLAITSVSLIDDTSLPSVCPLQLLEKRIVTRIIDILSSCLQWLGWSRLGNILINFVLRNSYSKVNLPASAISIDQESPQCSCISSWLSSLSHLFEGYRLAFLVANWTIWHTPPEWTSASFHWSLRSYVNSYPSALTLRYESVTTKLTSDSSFPELYILPYPVIWDQLI
jgi:hypothetical protein